MSLAMFHLISADMLPGRCLPRYCPATHVSRAPAAPALGSCHTLLIGQRHPADSDTRCFMNSTSPGSQTIWPAPPCISGIVPSPHLPASPRCDVCHPRVSSVAAITQCPGNLECTESPHLLSAPWPHTGHATSANCLNFISDALNTQIRSMTGGGNCVRKRRKGERANAK